MATAPSEPSGRRRPGVLVAALVALCLLAGGAVVVLALDLRAQARLDRDRQAALHVARQEAVNLTSISHRTADRDIERILSLATGELEEQFRSEQERLAQLLGTTRSTSEGRVLGAGVQQLEGRSATVLVATDASVTTAETGEDAPVLQRYRMSISLRKVGDRWLAERVLFAGAPS